MKVLSSMVFVLACGKGYAQINESTKKLILFLKEHDQRVADERNREYIN